MVAAPTARERAGVTADQDGDDTIAAQPAGSSVLRMAMAAVLVLLLVVAVAIGFWKFNQLRSTEQALDSRADVVRVAEQFTVAVNNYDANSVDQYQSRVSDMLSTKFRGEFQQAMQNIVAQVKQAKMQSQGKVLSAGVATIDNDSARVLVVSDATVKTVFDQRERHFRWEISLVKVDGKWLVDDFSPVT